MEQPDDTQFCGEYCTCSTDLPNSLQQTVILPTLNRHFLKCGVGEGCRGTVDSRCVKNEEVLHRVKEERNFLQTIKIGRLNGMVTVF